MEADEDRVLTLLQNLQVADRGCLAPRGDLDALGDTRIGADEFLQIRKLFAIKAVVSERVSLAGTGCR